MYVFIIDATFTGTIEKARKRLTVHWGGGHFFKSSPLAQQPLGRKKKKKKKGKKT